MQQAETKTTGIEAGVTLYHPYLEFHSIGWLKQTLLLWDTVRRIVPVSYTPTDEDEVRAAMDAGAVLNTDPRPYLELAEERFLNSWDHERAAKLADVTDAAASRMPIGHMGSQVGLWPGKLSDTLARQLEQKGVLRQDGEWYRVDGFFGGLYMTCLANAMAHRMNITCSTDRAVLQTRSRFFGAPVERGTVWYSWGLKMPTVEDVASVPMRKILQFSNKHRESKRALRITLSEIADAISACEDENEAQDLIRSKAKDIQSQLDDHKRRLSDLRVRAVTTFFRIDRPAAAVGLGAVAVAPDGLSKTLGLFGGFALGVADWWTELRTEYRDLTRNNPWHYLTALERRFGDRK